MNESLLKRDRDRKIGRKYVDKVSECAIERKRKTEWCVCKKRIEKRERESLFKKQTSRGS